MMSGVGGDRVEAVTCPACGVEISNVRWPHHFRSDACDGEVDL